MYDTQLNLKTVKAVVLIGWWMLGNVCLLQSDSAHRVRYKLLACVIMREKRPFKLLQKSVFFLRL